MLMQGKVAIVTGGSGGIGRVVARALGAQGCHLMLAARGELDLKEAQQELASSLPVRVEVQPTDVSDEAQVRELAGRTLCELGAVDVLVNCAGIYGPIGPAHELNTDQWLDAIRINLFGTYLCIKAVLPHMISKRKGKIINFSGGGSVSPFPRFSAYSASKAAVVRLTETIAHEVKQYNIDVNAVAPGAVNTRMLDQVLAAGEVAGGFLERATRQKQEGGVPPQKAAELVVFLASNASDGLTGRLISATWDNWRDIPQRLKEIEHSDVYTMRRILPEDRGFNW